MPIARQICGGRRWPLHRITSDRLPRAGSSKSPVGAASRGAGRNYLKARKLLVNDPLARGRIDRALIDVYMYLGEFAKAKRFAESSFAAFIRSNPIMIWRKRA